MGGRGSRSGLTPQKQPQPQNPQPQTPQPQAPQPQPPQQPPAPATPPLGQPLINLTNMTDDELATLATQSKTMRMPSMLADVNDITQRFVYAAGLNEKPIVLDANEFQQFMNDNNIPNKQILSRSVNNATYTNQTGTNIVYSAQNIIDQLKYGKLNYIGGKVGGQAVGAGTYFDMNGGGSTGYGSNTVNAVLNPATARVISVSQLMNQVPRFANSHPKFVKAVGSFNTKYHNNNMSVYALAMGYNVITDGYGYHNIIDRSALVIRD